MNNQSSYNRWTWTIALILAAILLWMLFTGRGPSAACCGAAPAPVEAAAPVAPIVEPAADFSFNASCNDFTHSGDTSSNAWANNPDGLKSALCSASGINAQGDSNHVTLTGTVDSDAVRSQIGSDTQSFLGADYTVDNQITVLAPVVAFNPPPAAKLYFRTSSTTLPGDSASTLAPIVTWFNENSDSNAKAVVTGYHDPRGSLELNQALSKGRAQSVYDALIAAGVSADRIEMREPAETTGSGSLREARRVEVSIEQ